MSYISGHLRSGGSSPAGVRDSDQVRVEQHRLPLTYGAFAALSDAAPADVAAVVQTLSLYGHAVDNDSPSLLGLVFAPDAVVDETSVAGAHHTVNTEVRQYGDGLAAWSRLITIAGDGSVASADVVDVLATTPDGWRVTRRVVHPRHGGDARIEDGSAPWA